MHYGVHRNDLKKVDRQEVARVGEEEEEQRNGVAFFSYSPGRVGSIFINSGTENKSPRLSEPGARQVKYPPLLFLLIIYLLTLQTLNCTCQGSAASNVSLPEQQILPITKHFSSSDPPAIFSRFPIRYSFIFRSLLNNALGACCGEPRWWLRCTAAPLSQRRPSLINPHGLNTAVKIP